MQNLNVLNFIKRAKFYQILLETALNQSILVHNGHHVAYLKERVY